MEGRETLSLCRIFESAARGGNLRVASAERVMKKAKLFRYFLAASLLPVAAWADDTGQAIVVTATRVATPVRNVPAGITVDVYKRQLFLPDQMIVGITGLCE